MSLASTLLGDLSEGFQLPIARRGIFSQDDFFSGFRNGYGRAVGDVLDRWGSRTSKADRFASYRRLRERDSSEDSQAATISETPEVCVIVLDMNEYASGEITVETVGLSAVVEGRAGQRRYRRQFPLPQNTIIDGVVADMSDENILTVTAPRKGKGVGIRMDMGDDDTAKSEQRSTCTSTANASSTQESGADISSLEEQIIPTEVKTSQTTSTTQERFIPTIKEGSAKSTTTQSVKTEELASSTRRGSKSRVIPLNIEGETTTTSETVVSEGTSAAAQTETSQTSSGTERVVPTVMEGGVSDATQAKSTTQATTSTTTSSRHRVLPIKRRGRFFQDSTFERVWDDFESVMDDLVTRRGSRAGLEKDRFQSYRNLRQCVQQEDNQAWNVTKDNGEYKIVVDVKEFVDDHLDVKAQEGAIVVTGKKGTVSFERRFSIPGFSQPDKVAAALSADGVLTITAPK